jgi:hypothetical protein
MDAEQESAPNQLAAEGSDLEAQRAIGQKVIHARETRKPETPFATSHNSSRSRFLPIQAGLEDASITEGWTGRDKSSIRGATFNQKFKGSSPLSEHEEINSEDFESRYSPEYTERARDGLHDVLTILHHENLDYLRQRLLKQYSLIAASAEIYLPGV